MQGTVDLKNYLDQSMGTGLVLPPAIRSYQGVAAWMTLPEIFGHGIRILSTNHEQIQDSLGRDLEPDFFLSLESDSIDKDLKEYERGLPDQGYGYLLVDGLDYFIEDRTEENPGMDKWGHSVLDHLKNNPMKTKLRYILMIDYFSIEIVNYLIIREIPIQYLSIEALNKGPMLNYSYFPKVDLYSEEDTSSLASDHILSWVGLRIISSSHQKHGLIVRSKTEGSTLVSAEAVRKYISQNLSSYQIEIIDLDSKYPSYLDLFELHILTPITHQEHDQLIKGQLRLDSKSNFNITLYLGSSAYIIDIMSKQEVRSDQYASLILNPIARYYSGSEESGFKVIL